MAVYLFFDESGDLDFTQNGSKYYHFGVLTTHDPIALSDSLTRLRYELLAGGVGLRYFHATENKQEVRNRVFEILSSVGGFDFDCTVIEKGKVGPMLDDPARFYVRFSGELLRHVFRRYFASDEHIVIITDRIPMGSRRKGIEKAFKVHISRYLDGRPYTLVHDVSASHPCLQAVDYCMWAVHRKWRDGDMRSYDLIRRFIRSEIEISGGREK